MRLANPDVGWPAGAGVLAVNLGVDEGAGADGLGFGATLWVADVRATFVRGDFFAAVASFLLTARLGRAAGAAFFAARFTADLVLPAARVLRLLALAVFFAAADLARVRFALARFDFAAFAEAFDFARLLAFAIFRASFLASFACLFASLAAFFSAFLAALAAAFSAFACLSSAFDFLAMLHPHSVSTTSYRNRESFGEH